MRVVPWGEAPFVGTGRKMCIGSDFSDCFISSSFESGFAVTAGSDSWMVCNCELVPSRRGLLGLLGVVDPSLSFTYSGSG